MNLKNIIKKTIFIILLFWVLFLDLKNVNAANYGIKVNSDGSLTINGKYFKAMGLNDVDLVWSEGKYTNSDFDFLANNKIPFIRVAFGGWWPKVYDWYYNNPDKYFALTDAIVKKAEEKQIGLIIDFLWNNQSFFYYQGEQRADMGNPNSKSVKEAKKFITEIINRYKDSPAVWGYEIGNEYNLSVDLYRPNSKLKFSISNDNSNTNISKDFYTTNELSKYYTELATTIKSLDSARLITGGDAAARKHAYGLYTATQNISWSNHTSWAESWSSTANYKDMIAKLNPNPINTVSTHLYTGYFKDGGSISGGTFSEYLNIYIDKAKSMKKALYIGEFDSPCQGSLSEARNQINTIKNSSVQLSSPWLAGSDGRLLKVSCDTATKSDFENLIKNEIANYNKAYQADFDNAWKSWKKTIKVNISNASYSLTKSNNYTPNTKSDYYLENDTVKLTVTPNSNYKITSMTVKTTSGQTVNVSNNQFKMPNSNVVIDIVAEKIDTTAPVINISIDGTEKDKERKATITISDSGNSSIVSGTYRIKYSWDVNDVTCADMKSFIDISVKANEKSASGTITIKEKFGNGRLYVCNENMIKDGIGNTLEASRVVSETMNFPNKIVLPEKQEKQENEPIDIPIVEDINTLNEETNIDSGFITELVIGVIIIIIGAIVIKIYIF